LLSFIDTFAESTKVRINYTGKGGYGVPISRSVATIEPVICMADKDAGYVEITFSIDLGVVLVQLTNSDGDIVDEVSVDTSIDNYAMLSIYDPDDSYALTIESDQYYGVGNID
jgi:hypothetical protein